MRLLLAIWIIGLMLYSAGSLMAQDKSVVLYLPFDENKGNVTKDISGNGNDAEFRGKPKWAPAGKFGSAIEFGTGNFLEVKNHPSLQLTTAMTIEIWSKILGDTGDNQSGVEKEPAWLTGEYNLLPVYAGGILLQIFDLPEPCNDEAIGPSAILDKDWHFVVGTWDGKIIKMYLDGKKTNELPCVGALQKGNGFLYIGCRGGAGRWVNGFLDEVKMYNRALTEKEIRADMDDPRGNMAVDPRHKLATSWGMIKAR